jgi:hypothetical protein
MRRMSDDPLDRIPSFDRVSIRAVVVEDGDDPGPALAAAGILDPIALPMMYGENQPNIGFGDGITPNFTAVLEAEQQDDDFGAEPDLRPDTKLAAADNSFPSGSPTVNLPAAFGSKPLAPARRPG